MGAAGMNPYYWARAMRLARWLSHILARAEPLNEPVRSQMEGFFGRNLEDVRINDSRLAGEVARRLGAEAFTVGGRIFTDKGKLDPQTPEGVGLLAHELTHVIQQTQPQHLASMVPSGQNTTRQNLIKTAGSETAQIAGYSMPSSGMVQRETEAEAQASEQVMRQAAESAGRVTALPEIDIDTLANIVYRLMRRDLMMERERAVCTK